MKATKETQELIDILCDWFYAHATSYQGAIETIAVASASTVGAVALTLGLDPIKAMHELAKLVEEHTNNVSPTRWRTRNNMPN